MSEMFSRISTNLDGMRFSTQNDFCRDTNGNSMQFVHSAAQIMQERANPNGPLLITELPCSEGKETWSIAAGLAVQGVDFVINAHDINPVALQGAQEPYETTLFDLEHAFKGWGLPPECVNFFEEVDDFSIQPTAELKRTVHFSQLDVRRASPAPADVVISNNMLSYVLNDPVAPKMLGNLAAGLNPNGMLITRESFGLMRPMSGEGSLSLAEICGLKVDKTWSTSGSRSSSADEDKICPAFRLAA